MLIISDYLNQDLWEQGFIIVIYTDSMVHTQHFLCSVWWNLPSGGLCWHSKHSAGVPTFWCHHQKQLKCLNFLTSASCPAICIVSVLYMLNAARMCFYQTCCMLFAKFFLYLCICSFCFSSHFFACLFVAPLSLRESSWTLLPFDWQL